MKRIVNDQTHRWLCLRSLPLWCFFPFFPFWSSTCCISHTRSPIKIFKIRSRNLDAFFFFSFPTSFPISPSSGISMTPASDSRKFPFSVFQAMRALLPYPSFSPQRFTHSLFASPPNPPTVTFYFQTFSPAVSEYSHVFSSRLYRPFFPGVTAWSVSLVPHPFFSISFFFFFFVFGYVRCFHRFVCPPFFRVIVPYRRVCFKSVVEFFLILPWLTRWFVPSFPSPFLGSLCFLSFLYFDVSVFPRPRSSSSYVVLL